MIHAVLHQIPGYAARSSFPPLLELMDCNVVEYGTAWERLQKKSWSAGYALRRWGVRHYGSEWNWLVPYAHELRIARKCKAREGDVVHFLMAEFGSPRFPGLLNRRGAKIVGTFHCSMRRIHNVLGKFRCLASYDRISVVSKSIIPFFIEQGYPEDRIDVTLHGVDTAFYCPAEDKRIPLPGRELRLLLVGSTERDHDFAADVMRRLAGVPVHLEVLTAGVNRASYRDLTNVTFLSGLSDQDLIAAYRNADLLFMPMLDCTANNVILESTACGTPVMVNATGGIPEYADHASNYILDGKNVDDWVDVIKKLEMNRDELVSRRARVRAWVEQLSWKNILPQYLEFYDAALASSR